MNEKMHATVSGRYLKVTVEPRVTEGALGFVRAACKQHGFFTTSIILVNDTEFQVIFPSDQDMTGSRHLVVAVEGTHEIALTLEEAGRLLSRQLIRFTGRQDWYFVGIVKDPAHLELVIYARTIKQGNELLSFVGHTFEGFPVRRNTMGRVTPLAHPDC